MRSQKVLYIISTDFREMNPNKKRNWCCGGGGLVAVPELKEVRMKAGKMKLEQIKRTGG